MSSQYLVVVSFQLKYFLQNFFFEWLTTELNMLLKLINHLLSQLLSIQ